VAGDASEMHSRRPYPGRSYWAYRYRPPRA
jgi:hypothetical protein